MVKLSLFSYYNSLRRPCNDSNSLQNNNFSMKTLKSQQPQKSPINSSTLRYSTAHWVKSIITLISITLLLTVLTTSVTATTIFEKFQTENKTINNGFNLKTVSPKTLEPFATKLIEVTQPNQLTEDSPPLTITVQILPFPISSTSFILNGTITLSTNLPDTLALNDILSIDDLITITTDTPPTDEKFSTIKELILILYTASTSTYHSTTTFTPDSTHKWSFQPNTMEWYNTDIDKVGINSKNLNFFIIFKFSKESTITDLTPFLLTTINLEYTTKRDTYKDLVSIGNTKFTIDDTVDTDITISQNIHQNDGKNTKDGREKNNKNFKNEKENFVQEDDTNFALISAQNLTPRQLLLPLFPFLDGNDDIGIQYQCKTLDAIEKCSIFNNIFITVPPLSKPISSLSLSIFGLAHISPIEPIYNKDENSNIVVRVNNIDIGMMEIVFDPENPNLTILNFPNNFILNPYLSYNIVISIELNVLPVSTGYKAMIYQEDSGRQEGGRTQNGSTSQKRSQLETQDDGPRNIDYIWVQLLGQDQNSLNNYNFDNNNNNINNDDDGNFDDEKNNEKNEGKNEGKNENIFINTDPLPYLSFIQPIFVSTPSLPKVTPIVYPFSGQLNTVSVSYLFNYPKIDILDQKIDDFDDFDQNFDNFDGLDGLITDSDILDQSVIGLDGTASKTQSSPSSSSSINQDLSSSSPSIPIVQALTYIDSLNIVFFDPKSSSSGVLNRLEVNITSPNGVSYGAFILKPLVNKENKESKEMDMRGSQLSIRNDDYNLNKNEDKQSLITPHTPTASVPHTNVGTRIEFPQLDLDLERYFTLTTTFNITCIFFFDQKKNAVDNTFGGNKNNFAVGANFDQTTLIGDDLLPFQVFLNLSRNTKALNSKNSRNAKVVNSKNSANSMKRTSAASQTLTTLPAAAVARPVVVTNRVLSTLHLLTSSKSSNQSILTSDLTKLTESIKTTQVPLILDPTTQTTKTTKTISASDSTTQTTKTTQVASISDPTPIISIPFTTTLTPTPILSKRIVINTWSSILEYKTQRKSHFSILLYFIQTPVNSLTLQIISPHFQLSGDTSQCFLSSGTNEPDSNPEYIPSKWMLLEKDSWGKIPILTFQPPDTALTIGMSYNLTCTSIFLTTYPNTIIDPKFLTNPVTMAISGSIHKESEKQYIDFINGKENKEQYVNFINGGNREEKQNNFNFINNFEKNNNDFHQDHEEIVKTEENQLFDSHNIQKDDGNTDLHHRQSIPLSQPSEPMNGFDSHNIQEDFTHSSPQTTPLSLSETSIIAGNTITLTIKLPTPDPTPGPDPDPIRPVPSLWLRILLWSCLGFIVLAIAVVIVKLIQRHRDYNRYREKRREKMRQMLLKKNEKNNNDGQNGQNGQTGPNGPNVPYQKDKLLSNQSNGNVYGTLSNDNDGNDGNDGQTLTQTFQQRQEAQKNEAKRRLLSDSNSAGLHNSSSNLSSWSGYDGENDVVPNRTPTKKRNNFENNLDEKNIENQEIQIQKNNNNSQNTNLQQNSKNSQGRSSNDTTATTDFDTSHHPGYGYSQYQCSSTGGYDYDDNLSELSCSNPYARPSRPVIVSDENFQKNNKNKNNKDDDNIIGYGGDIDDSMTFVEWLFSSKTSFWSGDDDDVDRKAIKNRQNGSKNSQKSDKNGQNGARNGQNGQKSSPTPQKPLNQSSHSPHSPHSPQSQNRNHNQAQQGTGRQSTIGSGSNGRTRSRSPFLPRNQNGDDLNGSPDQNQSKIHQNLKNLKNFDNESDDGDSQNLVGNSGYTPSEFGDSNHPYSRANYYSSGMSIASTEYDSMTVYGERSEQNSGQNNQNFNKNNENQQQQKNNIIIENFQKKNNSDHSDHPNDHLFTGITIQIDDIDDKRHYTSNNGQRYEENAKLGEKSEKNDALSNHRSDQKKFPQPAPHPAHPQQYRQSINHLPEPSPPQTFLTQHRSSQPLSKPYNVAATSSPNRQFQLQHQQNQQQNEQKYPSVSPHKLDFNGDVDRAIDLDLVDENTDIFGEDDDYFDDNFDENNENNNHFDEKNENFNKKFSSNNNTFGRQKQPLSTKSITNRSGNHNQYGFSTLKTIQGSATPTAASSSVGKNLHGSATMKPLPIQSLSHNNPVYTPSTTHSTPQSSITTTVTETATTTNKLPTTTTVPSTTVQTQINPHDPTPSTFTPTQALPISPSIQSPLPIPAKILSLQDSASSISSLSPSSPSSPPLEPESYQLTMGSFDLETTSPTGIIGINNNQNKKNSGNGNGSKKGQKGKK